MGHAENAVPLFQCNCCRGNMLRNPNLLVVQSHIPLMTSCLFSSLADSCLRTSSSTPFDQSTGSGSASRSLSHSAALFVGVGVTVTPSCARAAVTISKELLGLSRLLEQSLILYHKFMYSASVVNLLTLLLTETTRHHIR